MAMRCKSTKSSVKAIAMTKSGASIEGSMVGPPRRKTLADWCSVELLDEDTGVVEIELMGACGGCPMSTMTLKAGIERILKDRVEGVTEVINQSDEQFEGTPLSL